jgi:hypothetical protein
VLTIGLVALAHSEFPWRHTAIVCGLAFLWAWSGIVYHWSFFTTINPAANVFGAVFVLQAVLLLLNRNRITLSPRFADDRRIGWAFIVYAVFLYPVLGAILGHGYPNGPTFGAPCPVTLFFAGMMFWSVPRINVLSVAIPGMWAIVGGSAALQLGMSEDFALVAAAILLVWHVVTHRHVRVSQRLGAGAR